MSEHDDGGVLNASKAMTMLHALAVKKGVVVRDNFEVVRIDKGPKGDVMV